MKSGYPAAFTFVFTLVALLLGGCASYQADVAPGPTMAGLQRFFVLTNQNDNHGLDRQIAAALQARGRTVESGPRTMMPDDTQAIVTYEQRWNWDFGDHLVFLQITVRHAKNDSTLGTAQFNTKIPAGKTTAEIVGELTGRLLGPAKP
jgi:hypothetical protein